MLPGNASVISGFWILYLDLFDRSSGRIYNLLLHSQSYCNHTALIVYWLTSWILLCSKSQFAVFIFCVLLAMSIIHLSLHSLLAENHFLLNSLLQLTSVHWLVINLTAFSLFYNAGVLHVRECSVVYCWAWRHEGHVTPPHCCAIQCLPRNLATHGAERREGR
jgi:hypothetical protein